MPEIKTLLIRDLDDSFQIRANGTNSEKVQQYCEMFREYHGWGSFPPLTVVSITDDDEFPPGLYIADGIHRYQAALLANVGIQEVKCEVWEGGRDLLYDKSLAVNAFQGLGMSTAELRAARKRIIKDLWPTRKYSTSRLAEICHCSDDTIRNDIKKLESEGVIPTIEFVIGADGKEYPTKRQKPVTEYSVTEKPATPAIPHEYCAASGCGVPIWEDMKKAKDCTYVESDGKWYCSYECYVKSRPVDGLDESPDDEDEEELEDEEPVYVTCPKCGKRELEKNLHRAGWVHEKEEGYSGKDLWYCSKECRDWMKALSDESWKTEEPPARESAPSSSQASGAEPEQEEPDEFTFTDVDEETLPVCTEKPKEVPSYIIPSQVYIQVNGASSLEEALEMIKANFPLQDGNFTVKFGCIYENINNNLNNNININTETFTEFCVICKGKRKPVKFYISRSKYNEWKTEFSKKIDLDETLTECCKYYSNLEGAERLKPEEVYARLYLCLLKNAKQQRSGSNQNKKVSRYRTAGESYDDLIY